MLLPILTILSAMPSLTHHKPYPLAAFIPQIPSVARVLNICDNRPWSECYPYRGVLSSVAHPTQNDPHRAQAINDPNKFRNTVEISFEPGELHKTVAVPVTAPEGTRLFVRDASLAPDLPKGQRASIVIGRPLRFGRGGNALVGLYADQEHPITIDVTRDSPEGSGEIMLTINGGYFEVTVR